ncbi:MAG: hypothetical protein KKB94_03425, partial [Proteobacteria bacterium]|nr:hypothetical protein [Pseudomonadota bacterium]
VVAIADGTSPRAAALFAMRSKWNCYSIDPRLKSKGSWSSIKRLKLIPKKVEDTELPFFENFLKTEQEGDVVFNKVPCSFLISVLPLEAFLPLPE